MNGAAYRPAAGFALYPLDVRGSEARFLVEGDGGRRWQVNSATARLLEALAEEPSLDAVARRMALEWERPVDAAELHAYLERALVPQGLVVSPGGAPDARRGRLSHLSFRIVLVPSRWLRALSGALARAFHPTFFWLTFLAALAAMLWVLAIEGAGGALGLGALLSPTVILLTLASTFAHELGHAAACRRFGCVHGDLGFGVYLVFPVLYMEVHESWRLPRAQRAVVDAGGLYMQLLFALALVAAGYVWAPLHAPSLGTLALVGLTFVTNLNPLFRFDGYWLLSDVLGIPNLRARSMESLRSGFRAITGRGAWADAVPRGMGARGAAFLLAYGVASLGFFAYFFGRLVAGLPRFVMHEYSALAESRGRQGVAALQAGAPGEAAAAFLTLLPPTVLLLGLVLTAALRGRSIGRFLLRRLARPTSSAGVLP